MKRWWEKIGLEPSWELLTEFLISEKERYDRIIQDYKDSQEE